MKWLILLVLLPFFLIAQESVPLSEKEKAWLKAQKEITIGAMDEWAPLNFVDYSGKASGIGADIVAELNKQLGGKLKIVSKSWDSIYEQAKQGKIDAIMDITPKPEREAFFYFTKAYMQIPHVIVSRKEQASFGSLNALHGKKVALEKNVGTIEHLRTHFPTIEIKTYDTTSMALHAVSMGEADAYVGNRAVVSYKLVQEFLNSLKVDTLERTRKSIPLSIGVSKNSPELFSILEKSMEAFPREKLAEIFSKWSNEQPLRLDLTAEERRYLQAKKTLHFVAGNEAWAPFSFWDEKGNEQGLERDFLKLLESHVNVPIHVTYLPWNEAVKKAREHLFDGIISASPTPERSKDLFFSHAYYLSPLSVMTLRENASMVENHFAGKRIALLEGSAFEAYIKETFPNAKIIYAKQGTEGIVDMVLKKEADAAIDNLLPLKHVMTERRLEDTLEIAFSLYSETLSSFQYGLRNDEPLLLSIINKAINAFSLEEKKLIKERWEGIEKARETEQKFSLKTIGTLSPEELQWIKEHPTITVSNEYDWPPFDFMKNGKAAGLGVDYMNVIAQKVGLHVNFVQAPWEKLVERFKVRNIDVLQSVYSTPERQGYALFTTPFYTSYPALAVRKGSDIHTLEDLKGRKVALMKGYGTSEKLLQQMPEIEPVMCTNIYEALNAVSFGTAEAMVDSIGTMSYAIMEQMLTNLTIRSVDVDNDAINGDLHLAVTKEKVLLHRILQKGLDAITPEEHMALRSTWVFNTDGFSTSSKKPLFELTLEEKQWLKEHPIIRFTGDPSHLPFESFDGKGGYTGMVADFIAILENRLGIGFEKIPHATWSDALEATKEGRVDVISDYTVDEQLQKTHLSTKGYIKSPIVIVAQKEKHTHFVVGLSQLDKERIAVIKDYAYVDEIKKLYPKLNFVEVTNIKQGMEGVASGQYDALLCSLTLATYSIGEMGLHNLHVVGKTDVMMELGLSVKKEWAPLVEILNKALSSITPEESQQIIKRWGPTDVEVPFDFTLILEIIGAAFALMGALFYWNYLLKRQVALKTAELSALLKSFDAHVIASKTDLKGTITYVSDAFCEISGNTREELLGKNNRISRHPDNDPKVYETMWKIISSGGQWKGRIKNRKKDGGYYWVDSVIEQDFDASGNLIGYTSIHHDVTAHVELETLSENLEVIVAERTQALAFLNKEQQAIFDSASVGIVLVKERVITQCNKRTDEILGYAIGEQIGQSTDIWYVEKPDIQALYHHVWLGEVIHFEQFLVRKDGTRFWARLSGRAIDHLDKDKGVVVVVEDISREKEALEAIKKAKQLAEEATEVKSAFLANMSHEIRTPMNAIIGMAHLALQTELSLKQRNYLDKIDNASKHLLGIINDILDFSKIEAGKMSFEYIDFHLEDVMDHLADLSVIKAQEKGLELLFDIDTTIPTALKGDPLRLGQILINLVNNAIKFTDKGEVTLAVKLQEHHDEEVVLLFEVHDTGIGIDEAQQAKLFEAFSQADLSTTRQYGGSGLGLAISKHLVEMMHGHISVSSRVGEGSVFSFSAHFKVQEEQREAYFNDEDIKNLRILIVDDNASAREILENMLRSFHFDVDSVSDGFKAIERLRDGQKEPHPYNLVLIDWMMPHLNGIETIKKIHKELSLEETLMFIMITAYSKEELQQELEDVLVDGILIKPISPSTLLNSILNVLGKEVMRISRKEDKKALYREAVQALRGAEILLVEDNIVNQEIAREILEKEGMHIVVANDGKEALALVESHTFDGVLMDCQMPVMDGFEATRRMREDERFATLPILAMTANAMEGDKERCLECGMNDHISKPIDMAKLFLTMAKWITPAQPRSVEENRALPEPKTAALSLVVEGLDLENALLHVNNDTVLLEKLLHRFEQTQAKSLERIEEALAQKERQSAIREAHTLKGLAGNIGATALAEAARRLEEALQSESLEHAQMFSQTKVELESVLEHLAKAFRNEQAQAAFVSETETLLEQHVLEEKLLYLSQLLQDLDSEAVEVLETLTPSLNHLGYTKTVQAMHEHIAEFNFEEAQTVLKSIMPIRL